MNSWNLRKVTVAFLLLGAAIFAPAQFVGYHYSDNQWHPWWLFWVYQTGIIMVFVGFGLALYISISARVNKNKGDSGT